MPAGQLLGSLEQLGLAPLAAVVVVGLVGLHPVHDGVVEAQDSGVEPRDDEVLVVACVGDKCELSKIWFVAKVLGKVLFLYYTIANQRTDTWQIPQVISLGRNENAAYGRIAGIGKGVGVFGNFSDPELDAVVNSAGLGRVAWIKRLPSWWRT